MNDRTTGYKLLTTAAGVPFDVLATHVSDAAGGDETLVRIELQLGEAEDEEPLAPGDEPTRTADHEWGSFGFIFVLAVLSFADARPRGISDRDFVAEDEFGVGDLLDHLRYVRGELQFEVDYLRGRCMKTDVTVRQDGTVTLATRCRGEAAVRWVQRLKGEKTLAAMG